MKLITAKTLWFAEWECDRKPMESIVLAAYSMDVEDAIDEAMAGMGLMVDGHINVTKAGMMHGYDGPLPVMVTLGAA